MRAALFAFRKCAWWLWMDLTRTFHQDWRNRWTLAFRVYELRQRRRKASRAA